MVPSASVSLAVGLNDMDVSSLVETASATATGGISPVEVVLDTVMVMVARLKQLPDYPVPGR